MFTVIGMMGCSTKFIFKCYKTPCLSNTCRSVDLNNSFNIFFLQSTVYTHVISSTLFIECKLTVPGVNDSNLSHVYLMSKEY